MRNPIDKTYLPFTVEELKGHFTNDIDKQITYLLNSASRYHKFLKDNPLTSGISLKKSRTPRQIEKDERFWTITAIKNLFDAPLAKSLFISLLIKIFGSKPPIQSLRNWEECLEGDLKLFFEACLPPPKSYVSWLRKNLKHRQIIPYVLDAAERKNSRPLEGATHVDAILLNVSNGFSWLIESKVLSDISYMISFDNFRNQLARNIDVMMDNPLPSNCDLGKRDPKKSLFSLLTPKIFKEYPSSRLYGWLIKEYQHNIGALKRDLPHRENYIDWYTLQKCIGWVTFEDINDVLPNACPWL